MTTAEIQINPKMIVLAREARGISQKELALKLDASPSLICKAETENRTLTEEMLDKMSRLLKFPVSFFYLEGEANLPMSLSYRKRDHVSAKLLMPLEANINIYRLHVEILNEKLRLKEANVPLFHLEKSGSVEQAAKQLRRYWKMPKGTVDNLTGVLEENGVMVIYSDFGTERVDSRTIFTKDKQPVIVINKAHLADRQRFSLAYELGHLVMHTQTMPSLDRDISHEANLFAAGFLMPESEIRKDFSVEKGISIPLLAELKRKWKVSMISLLYRAADLGFVSDNQKRYLVQQFNRMKIRRREPPELDVPKEQPRLLRDLITKYKNVHRYSLKELAQSLHLQPEEFIQRYNQ